MRKSKRAHIKNIDLKCCANSFFPQKCRLCLQEKPCDQIVEHYLTQHKGDEVYCSRLEADVAERVKRWKFVPKGECVFCREQHTIKDSVELWAAHFCKFTGERLFKCSTHGMVKNRRHVSDKLRCKITEPPFFKGDCVNASICNLCNWTQLSEENLFAHLRKEHEITAHSDEALKTNFTTRVNLMQKTSPTVPNESTDAASNDRIEVPNRSGRTKKYPRRRKQGKLSWNFVFIIVIILANNKMYNNYEVITLLSFIFKLKRVHCRLRCANVVHHHPHDAIKGKKRRAFPKIIHRIPKTRIKNATSAHIYHRSANCVQMRSCSDELYRTTFINTRKMRCTHQD